MWEGPGTNIGVKGKMKREEQLISWPSKYLLIIDGTQKTELEVTFFFFSHKRLVPWKGFSRVPAGFQFYSVNLFVLSYFEILTVNEHTERRQYLHQKCTNNVPSCANDTFLFLSINEHTLWYHSEHKNPWEQSASTARSKTRLIPAVGQDKHVVCFFFQGNCIWLVYCCTITDRAEEGKDEPLTKERKALSCKFLYFLQISPWENVRAFMWESQGRGWWDAELRPSDFFFFSELDVAWVFILQPSL